VTGPQGPPRGGRAPYGERSDGFTLVEVIVVLVILAILAAIAIPALTGYIDKAQEKQYISTARNYMMACRATLSEAYATGELGNPETQEYIVNGTGTARTYNVAILGGWAFNDPPSSTENWVFLNRIADLIAEKYPSADYNSWLFKITLFGDYNRADLTMLNADGFLFEAYPEGSNKGRTYYVSYKMTNIDTGSAATTKNFWDQFSEHRNDGTLYDANAGYEVYELDIKW
jgi:prepilin-type N-terminal cleavage/methylation domain-containing protein